MVPAIILAAAQEAVEKKPGLPQLNPETFAPQLIWLAITYGILYFALSNFILPRIGRALDERRDRIQRDLDEAERLKNDTESAIAEYERALGEARGRASGIAKETRAKLTAETDRERASVEEQVASKLAAAEQRIATMKTSALTQVDDIARETAGEIVQKLMGSQATTDEIGSALARSVAAE